MTGSTPQTDDRAPIRSRVRKHVQSNVVAYLALFFALGGGTALAAAGTIGAAQLKSLVVRESAFVNVTPGTSQPAFETCAKGQQFMSGAAGWVGATSGDRTNISSEEFVGAPATNPTGFLAYGYNSTGSTRQFYVQVACLRH